MLQSFLAFNQNAASNLAYMLSNNAWMFLLGAGFIGTVIMNLKDTVESSTREEQSII